MGEISKYLKEKYSKSYNNASEEYMLKQKVKNSILLKCDKYLEEAGDEFVFEVIGKDLTYAVIVINEEPIVSKYEIMQISDTLFSARLREVEL